MTELLPCPFCGGKAEIKFDDDYLSYFVECTKCRCKSDFCEDTKESAVSTWNFREDTKESAVSTWNFREDNNTRAAPVDVQKLAYETTKEITSFIARHYDVSGVRFNDVHDIIKTALHKALEYV